ncbi:MAG TPA: SRPBCC family protein [Candidatus Limnocylindrales bacterium]|nr:SRPBCC family protein [Candidatus Limnocylindrales bacterium]
MTARNHRSFQPTPVSARVRIFVRRTPEVVFDFFADLRNEPQYNSQVSAIRKTSGGPIGRNTSFEGSHRGFGRVSWRLAEYDRPRHLVIEGCVGTGEYRWTSDFEPAEGGTWMAGRMEWLPPPRWRPFRRLLGVVLQINARRSFRRMAWVLEGQPRGESR